MRIIVAAAHAALFLLSPPIFAQTAPTAPTTAAAPIDQVAVPIWPTTAVPLSDNQPVAASFSLGQIEGIAPQLLSGVTAKGFARKVPVDGQTVGQVLVVTVAKGDREETITGEGMAAQFDAANASSLFPEKTVEVSGSRAALVAALERLAAPVAAKEDRKPESDPLSQNEANSGAPSNSEAAAYKSPTVSATPQAVTPDPVTEIRTTTQDCPVRIDFTQFKAIQQSKEQTFVDGVLQADGTCSDSEVSYPLKKLYAGSPGDITDLTAMTAWPQFQWTYMDAAGESHTVGEWAKDEDTVYTITENEAQCPISIDFLTNQAVPQAALVYTNRNGALQRARDCAASTLSPSIPMTESAAQCPLRHEFGAGISYELSMWTYVKDGVTYQAAPCADNGRSFVHQTIYADAGGNYICPVITNMDTRTATLQSRKRITIDGTSQYVTDCAPDTTTQAILSTTDTCMNPSQWTHDLDAGVSYGQERFYYLKATGLREYVTPCQTSAAVYPHDVTVTGYQNHDDQLWSYMLSTVTINVSGTPYTVTSSAVLPGAAQIPYTLMGTATQQTGAATYDPPESCNKYALTAVVENWTRPDNTTYAKTIGEGPSVGPSFACSYSGGQNLTDWVPNAESQANKYYKLEGSSYDSSTGCSYATYGAAAYFVATRTTTRDDNYVVSRQTVTKGLAFCGDMNEYSNNCGMVTGTGRFPYYMSGMWYCSYPTANDAAIWRAQLGW